MSVVPIGAAELGHELPSPTMQWWPTNNPKELYSMRLGLHGSFAIGREPGCDIRFENDANPLASRVHAQVDVMSGRVHLTDLGSTNSTYLNGSRVNTAWLRHGDRVVIGSFTLTVHYPTLKGGPTPYRREVEDTGVHVLDPHARFKGELAQLDAEYPGQLKGLKREAIDKQLADRMQCGTRTIKRYFVQLRDQLGLEGDGSQLVQDICDRLFGRSD